MTPDKIYIHRTIHLGLLSATEIDITGQDAQYIRKDALLEWAKSQKARLKQGYKHEWKNDDILLGGKLILDNLIEKIESL